MVNEQLIVEMHDFTFKAKCSLLFQFSHILFYFVIVIIMTTNLFD